MIRKISECYTPSVLDTDRLDILKLLQSGTGRTVKMHLQILIRNYPEVDGDTNFRTSEHGNGLGHNIH
jgi:hypothetical protein